MVEKKAAFWARVIPSCSHAMTLKGDAHFCEKGFTCIFLNQLLISLAFMMPAPYSLQGHAPLPGGRQARGELSHRGWAWTSEYSAARRQVEYKIPPENDL